MNEKEYQKLDNYLLFKELGTDALGVNYRAGEINVEERKVVDHHLLTEVYPFLSNNPNVWKKVSILLEGVKKSNIPKLFSPDKIIRERDKNYLVYTMLKGRTLEQVLEDSNQKDMPINFDLAFALAFAIADLIDIGSSIVVSGEKSFHGFLTPDNILVDYDGKIYLKNYGIYPYLSREESIFTEMVTKYGAWIAPEFLRKEKLVCQTDIYHLGYIIYRVLTGKYYSYSPEEDFETKFSNLSLLQHIPSADKQFLTNIITFFKKTLHPIPSQRFANIKEFKDYVSNNFHIEELSSVTFSLAYFMNSLYLEVLEEENKAMAEESAYRIPEEKSAEEEAAEAEKADDRLVEGILTGLEKENKSRAKLFVPLLALIVIVIAISTFIIINQQKQVKNQREVQMKNAAEMKRNMEKFKTDLESEYQKRLKTIEKKATTTEEEKTSQEEEIKKLREWQKEEMRKVLEKQKQKEDQLKQEEEDKKKQEEDAKLEQQRILDEQKRLEEEKKKKEEEDKKKRIQAAEAEKRKLKAGDLVALTEATEKPQQLKGKDPTFSTIQRRVYKGSQMTVRAMLLIDETGNVIEVKMIGSPPEDLKSSFEKALRKWKYKPAEKDKIKVKVWYPVAIKITF